MRKSQPSQSAHTPRKAKQEISVPTAVPSTSLRRLKANRRNAQKSTGPRTEEGKSRSRWNAVTHGLLAKAAVIPIGLGKEEDASCKELLQSMVDYYCPQGPIEHLLVERIAVSYWRLRRAVRAETGEIQSQVNDGWDAPKLRRQREFHETVNDAYGNGGLVFWLFRGSSDGCYQLVEYLKSAESDLKKEGRYSEANEQLLKRVFRGTEIIGKVTGEGVSIKERLKQLNYYIEYFQKQREKLSLTEGAEDDAMLSANLVPRVNGDLLIRYESAIEKQLYRAINELQALQELRLFGTRPSY